LLTDQKSLLPELFVAVQCVVVSECLFGCMVNVIE
jgi:hypothetical protein